jgi:DNA-binding CsgD family transcriptional regulator
VRVLKVEGVRLLASALERLSIAALVLDDFGRVVAMTQPAEEIVRAGKFLHLRNGSIEPVLAGEERRLEHAARSCVGSIREEGRAVVLRLRGLQGDAITVRACPLPRKNDVVFGAAALMIFEAREPAALTGFGLTAAEIEIACAVLAGQPVRDIARARNAAYETVRSQIKSIYSKAGAHSRAEFTARCGN